jgi:hypothetical protein
MTLYTFLILLLDGRQFGKGTVCFLAISILGSHGAIMGIAMYVI